MKDGSNFLTLSEFKQRFQIKTNFLAFHGVISGIKSLTKAKEDQILKNQNRNSFVDNFLKAKKPNRLAYKALVNTKQSNPSKSQEKWLIDCDIQRSETINWKAGYILPFRCTKVTKLIIFQFKLLHRRLATNDFLNKIGLRENDVCTFCGREKETLIHLFWTCTETLSFWEDFRNWLTENQIVLKNNSLSPELILGLRSDAFFDTQQYFFFLVARFFIWINKIKETTPKIERFPNLLASFKGF